MLFPRTDKRVQMSASEKKARDARIGTIVETVFNDESGNTEFKVINGPAHDQ